MSGLSMWEGGHSCWVFLGDEWAVNGIHDHVSHYGFTKEQVQEAFDELLPQERQRKPVSNYPGM